MNKIILRYELGIVRDMNDGVTVQQLILEQYPGMTEKALESIVQEAKKRWEIDVIVSVYYSCHA